MFSQRIVFDATLQQARDQTHMLEDSADDLRAGYNNIVLNTPDLRRDGESNTNNVLVQPLYRKMNSIAAYNRGFRNPYPDPEHLATSMLNDDNQTLKPFTSWLETLRRDTEVQYPDAVFELDNITRRALSAEYRIVEEGYTDFFNRGDIQETLLSEHRNIDQYAQYVSPSLTQIHVVVGFPILGFRSFFNLVGLFLNFSNFLTDEIHRRNPDGFISGVQLSFYRMPAGYFTAYPAFNVLQILGTKPALLISSELSIPNALKWLERILSITDQSGEFNVEDIRTMILLQMSIQVGTYVRAQEILTMMSDIMNNTMSHGYVLVANYSVKYERGGMRFTRPRIQQPEPAVETENVENVVEMD